MYSKVFNKITRCYAFTIQNKKANTILPIICENIINDTIIYLMDINHIIHYLKKDIYTRQCVTNSIFVDKITGAHTQFVESFNNEYKCSNIKYLKIKAYKQDIVTDPSR
ncbi:hypothetical protein H311_01488 [Anncaliia algerae PRA109]|nr:hypothetical protein H311_01488 [Anncaliia algerae PRA109]